MANINTTTDNNNTETNTNNNNGQQCIIDFRSIAVSKSAMNFAECCSNGSNTTTNSIQDNHHQQHQHATPRSPKSSSSSTSSNQHVIGVNAAVCHECSCCVLLEREIANLSTQLRMYENLFALTPGVLEWFDTLKASVLGHDSLLAATSNNLVAANKRNIINMSNISISQQQDGRVQQRTTMATTNSCNQIGTVDATSTTRPDKYNNTNVVPEIVIENIS